MKKLLLGSLFFVTYANTQSPAPANLAPMQRATPPKVAPAGGGGASSANSSGSSAEPSETSFEGAGAQPVSASAGAESIGSHSSANMSASSASSNSSFDSATIEKQIKVLEELVNISSDTKLEVDGVNQVQAAMARMLKNLQFKVEEIPNPDPFVKSGKLLVATYPGKSAQAITLVGHADTVFPAAGGFNKFERVSDTEARGPGVIDDKGSLIVAIEALRLYLEQHPAPPLTLRLIISPSEEVGSTGFLQMFQEYSGTSVAIFGLEPALGDGDIVNSRRGDRWYEVKVKGREAHSGRAHDQGVNACHELAIKIEKLQKLTNYKKEVTINIGAMHGGNDKFAIVCGEATAKVDVRFSDEKNRAAVIKKVEQILRAQYVAAKSDGARAVTEFSIVDDPYPFGADPAAKTLVDIYTKVIAQLEGKKIKASRSGGTADSNFFYRPGLIIIDGLGAVGSGMHTHEESIRLHSLQTRAQALAKLIEATAL